MTPETIAEKYIYGIDNDCLTQNEEFKNLVKEIENYKNVEIAKALFHAVNNKN